MANLFDMLTDQEGIFQGGKRNRMFGRKINVRYDEKD